MKYRQLKLVLWWYLMVTHHGICVGFSDNGYHPSGMAFMGIIIWLVVEPPLWKIWKSVGIIIWKLIEHVPNHQPDNHFFELGYPIISDKTVTNHVYLFLHSPKTAKKPSTRTRVTRGYAIESSSSCGFLWFFKMVAPNPLIFIAVFLDVHIAVLKVLCSSTGCAVPLISGYITIGP